MLPRCEPGRARGPDDPPFSAVPPPPASPCSRPAALRRLPNRDCSCASQVLRRPTPAQSPPTLRFGRPENARGNSGLPTALYPEAPLGGGVMPSATQWASIPSWVPQMATGTLLIKESVQPHRQVHGWQEGQRMSLSDRPAQTLLVLTPSKIRGNQHASKDRALGMDAGGLGHCRPWRAPWMAETGRPTLAFPLTRIRLKIISVCGSPLAPHIIHSLGVCGGTGTFS